MEQNPHSVSNTRNTNGNGHASLALVPLSDMQQMAKIGVESNFFGIKKPTEAMALMLIAQAEGKHPATVFSQYHVIQGRPALKADAMLARFQQAGGSVQWTERTDKACAATFAHPQGGKCDIRWTLDDAKRAGLLSGKSNWNQYPRQMLSARVVSEGVRAVFPGVLGGFYTPEEVGQFEPVAAAPVIYTRPEPQTPVLTDEADVIDVVPERIRNIAEDVVKLNTPDARLRKKQPVAALDEGADWEEATLIEKSTRSGQGAKGPWTVWKATLEMDNGKKLYPSTFDAELGAVLEECQEGETILVQIAAREYEDKKTGEMKKGYDLKAVSRQDVPAKAEDKAAELAEDDIPF
jgi:hypothetical protein